MGRKKYTGLRKRGSIWHIDKVIKGQRLRCSTGTDSRKEAEDFLEDEIRRLRDSRNGVRTRMTWMQAATKYLNDFEDKPNILTELGYLNQLKPFIGGLYLEQVHDDTLKPYVESRRQQGRKTKTINNALGVVRHILNLCADSWRHTDSGLTWLASAPKITMAKPPKNRDDSRTPYPLDWGDQDRLIRALPKHLVNMTLFAVNTGCREGEVCGLRWEWEHKISDPRFHGRIFIIPGNAPLIGGKSIKNREDRLVVCNDIAKSVIDECRGNHPDYVFTYRGKPVKRMNNTAWARAWEKSGLPMDDKFKHGVHNLRHTCATRLFDADVPLEIRRRLLGYKDRDMTTRYSAPKLQKLLDAVQEIVAENPHKSPTLLVVRGRPELRLCA